MTTSEPLSTIPLPEVRSILLAEDDIDDQEFLIEAIHRIDPTLSVQVASSGEKAVEYLQQTPMEALPTLIVLDYNLPKLNGHQILLSLQEEAERYRRLTKLVWSTSDSPQYKKACLDAGANDYFVKPTDLAGINRIAQTVIDYCRQ